MRFGKFRKIVPMLVGFAPLMALAETPAPLAGWELGAYFDSYFQSSPQAHGAPGAQIVEGRLFDKRTNQTAVNMVELSARRKAGLTTFRIDAAFGDMVDAMAHSTTASTEPTRNITQATITHAPTDRLTFTVGKFYTPIGFETTKAKDNWQYSRSFTFNYAIPLWHQGLSVAYAIMPSKLTGTVYVVNNMTGQLSGESSTEPAYGLAFNATPMEELAVNYVYMTSYDAVVGEGKRDLHDINAIYNINSQYAVAVDYTMGTQVKPTGIANDTKWNGLALYFKAQFTPLYMSGPA